MKYDKKIYNTITVYRISEEEKCHTQKLVKTRKEHKCCNCKKIIKSNKFAIRETCIYDKKRVSSYTCTNCADSYYDDIEIEKGQAG